MWPWPLPVSAATSGASMASLARLRLAALAPEDVGLKLTSVVHDWLGASTLPAVHVLVPSANWPASAPVTAGTEARVTSPCASLVNVTVLAGLVVPTEVPLNAVVAGLWARCPRPVPLSPTSSGVLMASLARLMPAALAPEEVGLNRTSVVQVSPGART